MFGTRTGNPKVTDQEPASYATGADFCRIFKRDMNSLYLLSFLLTGDHAIAEKCFVCGLEVSSKSHPVFKKWAESWARRTIIRGAIEQIRPRLADGDRPPSAFEASDETDSTQPAEILAVVALPSFERFVFVMSVLEHYSDQECSLLLDCNRRDVIAARTRSLQQIGDSARLRPNVASFGSASSTRTRASPWKSGPPRDVLAEG
jgi:hypothetical protein